jgi:hypothetical protein
MILLATLLLLAVVLVFVGYPLIHPDAPDVVEPASPPLLGQHERLLTEREHALATLQELEFEHSIGNLSDEDYAALQAPQRRKAVAILRELDSTGDDAVNAPISSPPLVDDSTLDTRLEEDIARVRSRLAGAPTDDVATPATSIPENASASTAVCPDCGAPHAVGARFCAECGRPLHSDEVGRITRTARGMREG